MNHRAIILWIFAILFGTVVCEKRIIRMKTGETLELINDKYPETSQNVNDLWMLGTSSGGAIKLECDDIRINSENCDEGRMMISAGDSPKVICDNRKTYSVTSLFESLYVTLELKIGEGAFRCKATALSSPAPIEKHQKVIHVETGSTGNVISHTNLERVMLYEYVITGDPGSKLIARCHLAHSDSQAKNKCDGLTLTLTSGGETRKYCETDNRIIFHTEDDLLRIDLKTGLMVGSGYLFCYVKSIIGGTYSKYKNIASEEVDSSEHGLILKQSRKTTTCKCGWANKDNRRIIYGHDAGPHEYPWAVSLQYVNIGFHFCGGSIISEYHILTAAHCIGNKKAQNIQVVIGTNNRSENKNAIEVKEIILHDYDRGTVQNDIAILVLQKKIEFNQFIGPVCLPSIQPKINHQYVTAMGWGSLADSEYNIKDPALLKETKLRAVDIYSCTVDWNFKWDLQSAKVMCTWSNHTDICMGDSGGPVVWLDPETNRYNLIGMPALCDGCRLTMPSVHTSVYHFYDWIQSKIAESSEPNGKTCTKVE
uniref:Venom S1 protease 13 n=1 Tax=Platymeris rhadamanthus TaxID=1134088 RepID=A0A6B9L6G3_PLARH|nr:venom S1 protease 13 [Platymeris rhadamanthus]